MLIDLLSGRAATFQAHRYGPQTSAPPHRPARGAGWPDWLPRAETPSDRHSAPVFIRASPYLKVQKRVATSPGRSRRRTACAAGADAAAGRLAGSLRDGTGCRVGATLPNVAAQVGQGQFTHGEPAAIIDSYVRTSAPGHLTRPAVAVGAVRLLRRGAADRSAGDRQSVPGGRGPGGRRGLGAAEPGRREDAGPVLSWACYGVTTFGRYVVRRRGTSCAGPARLMRSGSQ